MSSLCEAKLDVPIGVMAPDSFDQTSGLLPSDDFVVTRCRDGSPASFYGDLIWDFSAYTPNGKIKRVHFAFWGKEKCTMTRTRISAEIRAVAFYLIWRREGAPMAVGTIANYITVLCACADYADKKRYALADLLGSNNELRGFVRTRASGWMAETLASLLNSLGKVSCAELGFALVGQKCINDIKGNNSEYRSTLKQHPPIPTRIYSHLLASLQQQLVSWESVSDEMLQLLKACGEDPLLGRCRVIQQRKSKASGTRFEKRETFTEIVTPACTAYLLSTENETNFRGAVKAVIEIQSSIKLVVQAYTGMRDDEAVGLPYMCLEESVADGLTHYFVCGRTTKFNHGLRKKTKWVTCQQAAHAIKLAQIIADTVFSLYDIHPENDAVGTGAHPLFVSLRYIAMTERQGADGTAHFVPGYLGGKGLGATSLLSLTDEDINELEQIDPHRAWRSEPKFQVGAIWHFTSHQLRRSLALYAQRSGLVSLPSLRRQLQHITMEMARYYARGSAFARQFIGDNRKHFGIEWQAAKPESAALSYLINVLLNDTQQFGGHANWVNHRQQNSQVVLLENRRSTLKRFQNGEISYAETILGGCTTTTPCDKVAIRWLHVECIRDNCKNLVCSVPKLERVIAAQTKMVERLETTSAEYRTEKDDLTVLQTALTKITKKTKDKTHA